MNEKDDKLNKGSFLYIGDQDKAEWGYPEEYPHSEISETTIIDKLEISGFTYDQDIDAYIGPSESIMQLLDSDPTIREMAMNGKPFTIIWDGTPYNCVFNISISGFGNPSLMYDSAPDTGEPFLIDIHGIFTKENNNSHTVEIKIVDEIIYPMASDFLPQANQNAYGAIKKAAHVPHVTEAPTSNDFNKLLSALREAGIMSQSE